LAVVFSTIATIVALGLDAVGDISPTAFILTVIVVGFVMSWVRTGRVERTRRHTGSQRVVVVLLHHPIA
jgi:multisubunit Na+/H+ antiporter MnhC subunit